jgi:hypothetical protein
MPNSNEESLVALSSTSVKNDTSSLIFQIMKSNPEFFQNYIDSAQAFEIQIIYTQINRDKRNKPSFKQFSYRLNNNEYFCPASTSKLPASLIALEKINKLSKKGINKFTAMHFDSAHSCQEKALKDTIAPNSILCVANFIRKIMLVSDNDSYNRLFEFIGQEPINTRLWGMGFKKTTIIQQFNNCNADDNRFTNPMSFVDTAGKTLYSQPLVENKKVYKNPLLNVIKGKGYINDQGAFVEQPRDFSFYNNLPLQDLHDILLRTMFPTSFPKRQRFKLNTDDYNFLYKYMSMYPGESDIPKYQNSEIFPDNLKKYLVFGSDSFKKLNNSNIRIFNIVGRMSGYLTDCAYIVDFENNVEFVLAATIYNNQSGVFHVPNYRYKSIGYPFLQQLGQAIYNYELKREKKYKPNLKILKDIINKK